MHNLNYAQTKQILFINKVHIEARHNFGAIYMNGVTQQYNLTLSPFPAVTTSAGWLSVFSPTLTLGPAKRLN